MAIELAGLVLSRAAELATAGAFIAGVWEAVTHVRAKFRARRIAGKWLAASVRGPVNREAVDEVLARLSRADRAKVVAGLEQRSPAAAKRYLNDIFPTVVRSE